MSIKKGIIPPRYDEAVTEQGCPSKEDKYHFIFHSDQGVQYASF